MHLVKPSVDLLVRPEVNKEGMDVWLARLKAKEYHWNKSESDAENLVMASAKRCYMAFEPGLNPNVKKVRDDITEYLTNILSSRHGSVLAHATFTFGIEGVSRVFTGEMNRHAIGMAISEGSMRFISFKDMGLVETEAMSKPKDIFDELTTEFIKDVFETTECGYDDLMMKMKNRDYDDLPFSRKKEITSLARRAIGMGIATGGVWSGNIRALRWICEQRGTKHSEEEILVVAQLILKIMMEECPNLFGDFKVDDKGFWTPEYSKV